MIQEYLCVKKILDCDEQVKEKKSRTTSKEIKKQIPQVFNFPCRNTMNLNLHNLDNGIRSFFKNTYETQTKSESKVKEVKKKKANSCRSICGT